jgi:hypothetical protein
MPVSACTGSTARVHVHAAMCYLKMISSDGISNTRGGRSLAQLVVAPAAPRNGLVPWFAFGTPCPSACRLGSTHTDTRTPCVWHRYWLPVASPISPSVVGRRSRRYRLSQAKSECDRLEARKQSRARPRSPRSAILCRRGWEPRPRATAHHRGIIIATARGPTSPASPRPEPGGSGECRLQTGRP